LLPSAPAKPAPDSIDSDTLTRRIDQFLATRGLSSSPPALPPPPGPPAQPARTVERFVCEEDVRLARKEGRKLLVGERTIITPAARDAGEASKVFEWEGLRP
jgi:hypothetical protein